MSLTIPEYLLLGHVTADLTPQGRVPGGTVSYAIRTAAAFGLRVALLTSMKTNDPLLEEMRPYGEIISLPAQDSTTFENIYDADGRKQYVRGLATPITAADIPAEWRQIPLVHLAPIAGELDPQVAHEFKNSTVLLTLQGWLRQWGADGFVRFKRWLEVDVLKSIDIVVFSEEDILESPDIEPAFAEVVPHLIVTRAEKGGTYYHNGVPHDYKTPIVDLVQPTGAGDVFATSVLASLPRMNHNYLDAIAVAAQLGAICVTRNLLEGTPTPTEVREAVRNVQG